VVELAGVSLENVTKYFGPILAVSDFSLDIKDKEFVVLVGPSGCGKSTVLRMVAGLERATSGDIYIGDQLVNRVPPRDRDIAMVFQSYALYPHMTCRENMSFPLRLRKIERAEINRRVDDAAELLGITDQLDKRPAQLSGGQRQRVALGRAIVREPQVFLLDEPLSNLDAKLRANMRSELQELQKRLGITMIYVTHDQVEAMTMSDRICVLDAGKIQQVGTPNNVYMHPVNKFVSGFIGTPTINYLNSSLRATDGTYLLETDAFSIPVSKAQGDKILSEKSTGELVFGIRPEDIELLSPKTAKDSEIYKAKVRVIEPLGAETIIHLTIGDTRMIVIYSGIFPHPRNTIIPIRFQRSRIHLFDSKNEQCLAIGLDPV